MAFTFDPERVEYIKRAKAQAEEAQASMAAGIKAYEELAQEANIPALTQISNAQTEGFAVMRKSFDEFMATLDSLIKYYQTTLEAAGY